MPIHLTNSDRRQFLGIAGSVVALNASSTLAGNNPEDNPSGNREQSGNRESKQIDPELVVILNDTHIGEKHPPDSTVPSNLRFIVGNLTQQVLKPAGVLINGDLALKDGQPGDYQHFSRLVQPLRDAGIETHLTLGNHDNREVFYEILKDERRANPTLQSLHVSVVKTRHANFFLLNSLKETMVTQGTVGSQQMKWLETMLDEHADKAAIIVTHHNPRLGGDPLHFPGGLIDSQELWDVLTKRLHVKAYIHGHIHDRGFAKHRGIHIINTLATSYVADPKTSTTGWTSIRLNATGAVLTTYTTDPRHPWNGKQKKLRWSNT